MADLSSGIHIYRQLRGTPMSRRSRLGPTGEALVRLWCGMGFVISGAWAAVATRDYQPGDIRGTPGFWVVIGAVTVVIGVYLLVSGGRALMAARRLRP